MAETPATILVVEDTEDVRRLLVNCLEREGYAVHAAADGREGLQSFDALGPDLVLTDILMPYNDGFTVLRHVRNSNADIGVVVMSGMPPGEWVERAMREGATAVLRKPIDLDTFLSTVKEALKRKE